MFSLILIFFVLIEAPSAGATDIMPLTEVEVGMKGYALTVFQGTQIEEFPVEVVAIYPNFIPKKDIFLIRLGGKAEFTGVVAGMSGSPVYLEGRLAGAIAYSFMIFGKEPIAGVTPIEEMLAVRENEKYREHEELSVSPIDRAFFRAFLERDYPVLEQHFKEKAPRLSQSPDASLALVPILLRVSGNGERTLRLAQEFFASRGFRVATGGGSPGWEGAPLAPGAPLSVVLMDGDLGIDATGTVTYVQDGEVFGFGHSFFESGPTRLPMAQSTIVYTMSSEYDSYKLAAPGKVVGTLRQDRFPSVYGRIGEVPPMVPMKVTLTLPRGEIREFSYRLADDYRIYDIASFLGLLALFYSVESGRQSFEDHSVTADITVHIKGHGKLRLSDFYGGSLYDYPGEDTALGPLAWDFSGLLEILYGNGFELINLEGLDVSLRFEKGRKVAEIEDIFTPRREARPGDTIPVFVKVRPFMKPVTTLRFNLTIPPDITEESVRILIGDSSAATHDSFLTHGDRDPRNFADVLSDLRESLARRRDRLYVRITRATRGAAVRGRTLPDLPPSVSSVLKSGVESDSISQVLLKETYFPMGYEIIGAQALYIRIKREV
ncbi:MAG: SpoIVB peptidase S55 domain-containing protein [bacterium JZ-2024 1]